MKDGFWFKTSMVFIAIWLSLSFYGAIFRVPPSNDLFFVMYGLSFIAVAFCCGLYQHFEDPAFQNSGGTEA